MFDTTQSAFQHLATIVSENRRPLVAWVGAGLSRPAGLPSWGGLRELLTNELEAKARSLSQSDNDTMAGKLRACREQENFWIAFRLLRDGLGETSYRALIKNALGPAATLNPPQAYASLWKLRLSGLLNLNLDQFAAKSFVQVHGVRQLTQFQGKDASQFAHVLQSPTSAFAANLHGITEDVTSWVFTDDELKRLTDSPGYRQFINACIIARTIIFIGITAEDVAAGGHVAQLRDLGIDFGTHFWITDKHDAASDAWAEKAGVRVIRYTRQKDNHEELGQCIDALLRMTPAEETVRPVFSTSSDISSIASDLPSVKELVSSGDPEFVRKTLNAQASRILSDESESGYSAFEEFCLDYDEAINRAWYVPANPTVLAKKPHYLMDYRLLRPIATGGFGTVYEAESRKGETVAIKILREAVRADAEHLQSFRRGVRSMRLLTDQHVEGVVKYHDATEIPAMAVMEYVPGPTLHEAVQRRPFSWQETLRIGSELANILRSSHRLPQRVLHRDFRPKNIMFREAWDGDSDWRLVVLDFDLSWHKDSQEKSMTLESYSGYLAPEQVARDSKYSTRNALVDSYGLGMTLYYVRTRREPTFSQPGQATWSEHLQGMSSQHICREWKSIPRRFFRLVLNSTLIDQPRRWDVTQIGDEMLRLRDAIADPLRVRSAELLAEEIGARAFPNAYTWDPDRFAAVMQVLDESKVFVLGNESDREVELNAHWTDTGTNHYAQTKEWGDSVIKTATTFLGKAGWSVRRKRVTARTLSLVAYISVDSVVNKIDQAAKTVAKINELLIRK